MIVYHGSYCIVDNPHTSFSRDALDFGKGFYVTKIEEQALKRLKYYKPNQQICIINQEIIDKYLKYQESKEV